MCVESAYYDSCVFLGALNKESDEHEECKRVTDAGSIEWVVCVDPILIGGETTIGEYVDAFEVQCALQGVTVRRTGSEEIAAAAREQRRLRKELGKVGFVGRDWRHLMAAVASDAKVVATVDLDFWDPSNKGQRKGKKRGDRVKRMIRTELGIDVMRPSELRGCGEADCEA